MPEPQLVKTPRDLSGTTLGRFAVRKRLGGGGMGEVYHALDTRLNRSVAIKRIAPGVQDDSRYRERFLKEAERASQVTDRRIAGLYDVLEEKGELFLVMEFVDGGNLRQRMQEPMGKDEFLAFAIECAGALAAAHAGGVVHCDIKPENIMLTPSGEVKILDFGLAKRLPGMGDTQSTAAGASATSNLSGTPAYMAPEALLDKPLDGRADIFSLGIVFYEVLAGRHPFLGDSFVASIDRVLREEPVPLRKQDPEIPAELERIVDKMLAKVPADRYADASQLAADLERLRQGRPRLHLLPSTRLARRRLRQRAMVAAPVLLLAAFLLLTPWRQWLGVIPVPDQKHIVVLPFEVTGGDPDDAAYAAGLSEKLRSSLTRLTGRHPNIQVVPRSEMLRDQARVTDVAEARTIGANLVIGGTVQRWSGGRLRVSWMLVDTRAQRQVGGDSLTFESFDPFLVEDTVVASVLNGLELQLSPAEHRELVPRGTKERDAHVYYVRGRGYLEEYHTLDNVENAIRLFRHSLEIDPRYALAHAGLGQALLHKWRLTRKPERMGEAQAACERALELDRSLAAPAYTCLGQVDNETGHYEQAMTRLQRALELDPTSDDAYRELATAYTGLDKLAEAEATFRRAIEVRPHYWAPYMWLGRFYYQQGRLAEARGMFQEVITLAPDSYVGYSNLGAMYLTEGRFREAIPTLERSAAIRPNFGAYSNLGTVYFYERRFQDAAESYRKAISYRENVYSGWGNLGHSYYFMGAAGRAEAQSAFRKAIELAEEELRVNPREAGTHATLAMYYAKVGQHEDARRHLRLAVELKPSTHVGMRDVAVTYKVLGDRQDCLRWLQKAVAAGYSVQLLRAHPIFDDLHDDPAFQAFAGKS